MAQRRKTLKEETIDLLRASNTKLEQELSASRRHVREVENLNVELAMKCGGTEQQIKALYNAVSTLSIEVGNNTAAGRKARQEARKALESCGIPPPSTLGSSRKVLKKRSSKRRGKKKTS